MVIANALRCFRRRAGEKSGLPSGPEPVSDGLAKDLTAQEYWSRYNVTGHRMFGSREESLSFFTWRTEQYYDYLTYMPVTDACGLDVLDYGCGPGHDLVGFWEHSRPRRLVGMDVSFPSLDQAKSRLGIHGADVELIHIDEKDAKVPLPDKSFDYIHCSGVLHHVPRPLDVLREFRRLLRPAGRAHIMVYNYDCIWLHLYAAYIVRRTQPEGKGLTVREAFKRSTDTADCPISQAWTPMDVIGMGKKAGFHGTHLGNAVSVREIAILPQRFDAILDPDLEYEHRRFLLDLTFDSRGVPYHESQAAGIDGCYRFELS